MRRFSAHFGKVVFLPLLFGLLGAQEELFRDARKLMEEGKPRLAVRVYTDLYYRFEGTELARKALFERAQALAAAGDTMGAIGDLNALLAEDPPDSEAYRIYGLWAKWLPDSVRQGFLWFRFARRHPLSAHREAALEEAVRLLEVAAPESALAALKLLSSDYSPRWEAIARLRARRGDAHRAALLFRRLGHLSEAAQTLLEAGDTLRALPLALQSRDPVLLGGLFLRTGAPWRVLELPDAPPDLRVRALLRMGQVHAAESLAQKASLDTLTLARLSLAAGNPEQTLRMLEGRTEAEAESLRAWAWFHLGRLHTLLRAPALPDSLRYLLARTLADQGLFETAAEVLSGVALFPQDSLVLLRYRLALYLGPDSLRAALKEQLRRRGLIPYAPPSPEELLEAYRTLPRRGREATALQLLTLGAYADVIRLLGEADSLPPSQARPLAHALLALYRLTEDTLYARQLLDLLDRLGLPELLPFRLRLHLRFHPEAYRGVVPETPLERLLFARIQVRAGALPEARRILEGLAGTVPPDSLNRAWFELYLAAGDLDSAFRFLDLSDFPAVYRLAQALYRAGRFRAARLLAEHLPDEGFALDGHALALRALAAFREGSFRGAWEAGTAFLSRYGAFPEAEEVRAALAEIALRRGEPARAYLLALPLQSPEGQDLRARALLALNLPDLAVAEASSPPVHALALARAGRWKEAVALVDSGFSRSALRELAEALSNAPDTTLLASLRPWLDDTLRTYLQALWEARRGDVVTGLSLAALLPDPLAARVFLQAGIRLAQGHDLRGAQAALREALSRGEDTLRARAAFHLGTVLYTLRRLREATDLFRQAAGGLRGNWRRDALYNLAVIYRERRRPDSAALYDRELARAFPTDEEALQALSSLAFIQAERDPQGAISLYRDLEGELPDRDAEAELKYWMGRAYLAAEDPRAALSQFLRLYRFHGGDWWATGALEAAKLLTLMGRPERAIPLYEEVIRRRGKGDPFAETAQQELQALRAFHPLDRPSPKR